MLDTWLPDQLAYQKMNCFLCNGTVCTRSLFSSVSPLVGKRLQFGLSSPAVYASRSRNRSMVTSVRPFRVQSCWIMHDLAPCQRRWVWKRSTCAMGNRSADRSQKPPILWVTSHTDCKSLYLLSDITRIYWLGCMMKRMNRPLRLKKRSSTLISFYVTVAKSTVHVQIYACGYGIKIDKVPL